MPALGKVKPRVAIAKSRAWPAPTEKGTRCVKRTLPDSLTIGIGFLTHAVIAC
jgi:hypothetical protein